MKVKKGFWIMVVALVWVFQWTPVQAASLESLYTAAKKEGEMTYWGPIPARIFRYMNKAFGQKFPGIKIKHFQIRPDDYAPRAAAEARQGIVSFDLGVGRFGAISPLIDRDLIQSFDDWTKLFKDIDPGAVSKDGKFLARYDLVYVVAYNTKLVKPEEAPKSWDDLLDPKWKGKILFEPRGTALAYPGLKWGKEKTLAYVRKLNKQDLIFVKGGTSIAKQLVAGAGHIAVGSYIHRILRSMEDGAPINWVRTFSPLGAAGQDSYVLKGAKHPNAARLYAGWVSSRKAQDILFKKYWYGAMYPGSRYIAMKEIQKHGVEVVRESGENWRRAGAINRAIVKEMGVLR